MGINIFPVPVTSTGGLTKKRIAGSPTIATNSHAIPVTGNAGTATGGVATKFANSIWVAIQPGGRLLTSTDGATWNFVLNNMLDVLSKRTEGYSIQYRPTINCLQLEFANGTWVAYFSNSVVLRSTDLITWTVSLDLSSSTSINGTGDGLNKAGSPGSIIWNGTANLWMLVNNGKFVYTSPDLTTWTERTSGWTTAAGITAIPVKVIWANQLFIIIDDLGQIVTSADGISYTLRTAIFGGTSARDIATNGLGSNASATTVIVANSGKWGYSTNGTTWTINTANSTVSHTAIVWDGSKFVVGTATAASAFYSTTGTGGLAATATPTSLPALTAFRQQLATNGSGVVVAWTTSGFIRSTDATVSWSPYSSMTNFGGNESATLYTNSQQSRFSCVDGAGKVWLVSGKFGRLFVSSDGGTTWTFHNSTITQITNTTVENTNTITGVYYLNNLLFASNNNNGLYVSSDNGATWGTVITGFTNGIIGMAYGNGAYIAICATAVGASSTTSVFRSTNGTSWSAISSGSTGGVTSGLFYNNGGSSYDTWLPQSVIFVDGNPGWFEIIIGLSSNDTLWKTSRSVNGSYWVDGTNGAIDGNDFAIVHTINIQSPFSTSQAIGTYTFTPSTLQSTVPISRTSPMQFESGDGKTVMFVRHALATSKLNMFIAVRNNATWQSTRNNYIACKVNNISPFLNPQINVTATTQVDVVTAADAAEPVHLSYNANIGWVAAYYCYRSNTANSNGLVIISSTDGINWEYVGQINHVLGSTLTNNYYVFTNKVDKVFVLCENAGTTAGKTSGTNFYSFPVVTQPSIA
jgi:hypothetical protein